MDRKRAATIRREEDEWTRDAVIVTPEKAKKPRRSAEEDSNSEQSDDESNLAIESNEESPEEYSSWDSNPHASLLQAMKGLCLKMNEEHNYLEIFEVLREFIAMRQDPDESLPDFYKRWSAQWDKLQSRWGFFAPTKQVSTINSNQEEVAQQFQVCAFLASLNRAQYGQALDQLKESFASDSNRQPCTIETAMTQLSQLSQDMDNNGKSNNSPANTAESSQFDELDQPNGNEDSQPEHGADNACDRSKGVQVTADTIMGFPKYPDLTNREIMTQHYGFVLWAKSMKEKGSVFGRLSDFLDWAESLEGKDIELLGRGQQRFTYGMHKGETFEDIARRDPGYHVRFNKVLAKKGQAPDAMLAEYINWFEKAKSKGKA